MDIKNKLHTIIDSIDDTTMLNFIYDFIVALLNEWHSTEHQ